MSSLPNPAPEAAAATPSTSAEPPRASKNKFNPITLPTSEQMMMEDVMGNCVVKTGISGIMGGLAGVAFGLFSASMENAHGGLEGPLNDSQKSTRVVLREMALNMKSKSVTYAKTFALFGSIYSFNECVIEKFRAKHDKVNPALAGCVTGGMLAFTAGPQAMCIGCVSIGAFSLAIEHFFDR